MQNQIEQIPAPVFIIFLVSRHHVATCLQTCESNRRESGRLQSRTSYVSYLFFTGKRLVKAFSLPERNTKGLEAKERRSELAPSQ